MRWLGINVDTRHGAYLLRHYSIFMNLDYREIIAIAVIVVAAWIVLVFYRVGREEAIKKVDFWKAQWKIVLFWILALVVGVLILYGLNKLGLVS